MTNKWNILSIKHGMYCTWIFSVRVVQYENNYPHPMLSSQDKTSNQHLAHHQDLLHRTWVLLTAGTEFTNYLQNKVCSYSKNIVLWVIATWSNRGHMLKCHISMALHKTAVTPLLTYCNYCCLPLSHWYVIWVEFTKYPLTEAVSFHDFYICIKKNHMNWAQPSNHSLIILYWWSSDHLTVYWYIH